MPAFAQGNVTVYGIVDAALARISNADAAGNAVTKMPSLTGSLPSCIGFRGEEALGGGLSAVFALKGGFGPDTGISDKAAGCSAARPGSASRVRGARSSWDAS